jgi:uncharacterized protein YecE (DUF72 family)
MAIKFGTCSWNYDSWVGLVYSEPQMRAVDYLTEYAKTYDSVEVDSWFYKLPTRREVEDYAAAVPREFTFTCKAPRDISLTHFRNDQESKNPAFLSVALYKQFLENLAPIAGQLGAVILEFEYLNKKKMPNREAFMEQLQVFIDEAPKEFPLAIECCNGSWLDETWFAFLNRAGTAPVLSEKQFLPPIANLASSYKEALGQTVVVRLLGGDRLAIEKQTLNRWNEIVDPKPQLPRIAAMLRELAASKTDSLGTANPGADFGEMNSNPSLGDAWNTVKKDEIYEWLHRFCRYNTFEISIPALRDPDAAPSGKTGVIISALFSFELTRRIREARWYEEFKRRVEEEFIDVISSSIYPGLKDKLLFSFSFSPVSIYERVGSSEGSIVGWSFEEEIPVVTSMFRMADSVKTALPDVYAAGKWVYSPAGGPTAVMTGRIAAKRCLKR